MSKSAKELLEEYKQELEKNDAIVEKELYTKDRTEMSKEFATFIMANNCKTLKRRKGGKNGK